MGTGTKIAFGVCYYPEHWPMGQWQEDLQRMQEVGIGTVRIGEFAWSILEPVEGGYEFGFFDQFLDLCEKLGMEVVFGTPTATPPAWMSHRYPEILNTDRYGHPYEHGGRRHYNYNSKRYQDFAERIVEALARHFGRRKCITAWQIDNEVNCEQDYFYSEADQQAFREFLKEKYGCPEELNRAWGAVFWNQTYSSWDQIRIPGRSPGMTENPHQKLDYIRFISESARSFVKRQSRILRRYIDPSAVITTNGIFEHLDSHRMCREALDVISYDSYPNFAFELVEDPPSCKTLNDRKWGNYLSQVRSVQQPFWVMEQQSGGGGWTMDLLCTMPKPGQLGLWVLQSIAHGADYISFFRWRTCPFGTEMYWHGILDYCGEPNRRLLEVQEIIRRVNQLEGLPGSRYEAEAAILRDYDNLWDTKADRLHQLLEEESSRWMYTAASCLHTPVDYVYLSESSRLEELVPYRALFYPHAMLMDRRRADLLRRYVEQGGTLVLGAGSGRKDMQGHCVTEPLPGLLGPLVGAVVQEYTLVGNWEQSGMEWEGQALSAPVFHEVLQLRDMEGEPEKARVEAVYTGAHYRGKPGMVSRSIGKGRVYYYGATFDLEGMKRFLHRLGLAEPYQELIELPPECELAVRSNGKEQFFFLLNYTDREQEVRVKEELWDGAGPVAGRLILGPYQGLVLRRENRR